MTTTANILNADREIPTGIRANRADEDRLKGPRTLLISGILLAPLALGAVLPWAWGGITLLAVSTLILWARTQVRRGRVVVEWSPLFIPCVLFLLVTAVQYFADTPLDRTSARESLIKLATDILIFFLAAQVFSKVPQAAWRKFLLAVIVCMFGFALLGILQYLSSNGLIYWSIRTASDHPFGPYGNRNHYAGLMEMMIPLSMAGVLGRRGYNPLRAFSLFVLVVALASVFLSGSRGGFVALLVEAVILAVILMFRQPRSGTRSVLATAVVGVLASVALFLVVDSGPSAKRLATVAELSTKPEATFADRWLVDKDSLRMMAEHPWTGIGLGGFAFAYPRYQSFASDLLWEHAHNDYAEALVETGISGAVPIIVALGMFFALAFHRLRRRLESETGWIRVGAAVGCCGLLVHSFADFNLHVPANAAWFAMCVALAACGSEITTNWPDGRVG